VTDRIEGDAKKGPWTAQTGKDFLKKTAEGIPVVGKILKAFWG